MIKLDKQLQCDWLQRLGVGTKVVCPAKDGSVWIKADSGFDDSGEPLVWVNISTGETAHFSSLADDYEPPRLQGMDVPRSVLVRAKR